MGGVAGVTATLFVGVASGFALLVSGLSSLFGLGGSAAATGSAASGYIVAEVVAGNTLLAMSGVRNPQDGAAPRHAEPGCGLGVVAGRRGSLRNPLTATA